MIGSTQDTKAFTLIELLVVLAIVSSIGALVAPNLWKSLQRSNERQKVIEFGSNINTLRRELHRAGKSILVPQDELAEHREGNHRLAIAKGWVVTKNSEIFFLPTGVTNGGVVQFEAPSGSRWTLTIRPLDGKLEITAQ
ncbi:MAG: type II secretion system GspH family protein [Pseudomonadales bacterium]|nr:type II secretion system GspH family protein [Pseudomonadales bacterium]